MATGSMWSSDIMSFKKPVIYNVTQTLDKIEIGTPGKGGVITIHGKFSDPIEFKNLIDTAVMLRRYAAEQMSKEV